MGSVCNTDRATAHKRRWSAFPHRTPPATGAIGPGGYPGFDLPL